MQTPTEFLPETPGLLARLLRGARWYGAEWYWTVTGGVLLALVILITLLAPWISPYDPIVSVGGPFEPPGAGPVVVLAPKGTAWSDPAGHTLTMFYNTTAYTIAEDYDIQPRPFQTDVDLFDKVRAGEAEGVLVSAREAADLLAQHPDFEAIGEPFGPRFLLGSDNLGRDVLSRLIWGARTVLLVAILSAVFSALVGIPLGLLSGFFGGRFDRVLSLVMDSIYAFPGLILAIAVAAVLGSGVVNIAIAIAVVYIPTYFRMTRSQVLSIKEELYVEAARALGARRREILSLYILPNVIPTLVVIFSLNVADAILTEAGLAFLGLGLQPPTPDWGFDLNKGKAYLPRGYWWQITFPGLMITLVALGFSLLGEGLGEILNPRLTEE